MRELKFTAVKSESKELMKPLEGESRYNFILGDCLSVLKEIESESVDCIITSPPYWGMRAYDNEDDEHEIGNEPNFVQYVNALGSVFSEAKRILKKEGSFWLNLGDRYIDKNLLGMPWRVALSLMDNGWILRNDVIWHQLKGTQSCKDRLRDSYEHIFHFVKSKKYFYDADSIRIKPSKDPKVTKNSIVSSTGVSGKKYRKMIRESLELTPQEKINAERALDEVLAEIRAGSLNDFRMTIRGAQRAWHSDNVKISGRAKELVNKGYYIMRISSKGHLPSDVWNIVTEDTWRTDSHCAVYPEELLYVPIQATCPENGIVLDPFSGTGTTVCAALKLGRRGVGIDLSPKYIEISKKRVISNIKTSLFNENHW
ncbi:MAG: site-specific DNA-methyltransferase [Bacteroides sp.]|nr:site-specific DNA-methyltransferase [Bacteroides sp.]MDE6429990.1 site-specific DNA-methyltransferase [Duncaniella sp.]MDE6812468.1 site-specific DNA-methyltransferase [Duncaniella sp.]